MFNAAGGAGGAGGAGSVLFPAAFGGSGAGGGAAFGSGAVVFIAAGGVGGFALAGGAGFVSFPAAAAVLFNAVAVPFSAAAAGGEFEVEFDEIVVFEIITAVPFATLGSAVVEEPAVSVTVEVIVFGGSETVEVTFWPETSWVMVDVVPGWVRTMMIT